MPWCIEKPSHEYEFDRASKLTTRQRRHWWIKNSPSTKARVSSRSRWLRVSIFIVETIKNSAKKKKKTLIVCINCKTFFLSYHLVLNIKFKNSNNTLSHSLHHLSQGNARIATGAAHTTEAEGVLPSSVQVSGRHAFPLYPHQIRPKFHVLLWLSLLAPKLGNTK